MIQESRSASIQNGETPIAFNYRFTVAKLNVQQFDQLVNVLYRDLIQFVPNVYMSLYFKQLVSQQTLVWSLLHDSDDSLFTIELWRKVLETISNNYFDIFLWLI
jgi:hypothetical protein